MVALIEPNVGDIWMMSHLTREVAYAFAEGRGGVSAEFIEDVEPELNKLAPSLELFADAVESNGKVLDQVDQDVITGITKVMFCCCQTLQDLGILVTSPRSSPLLRRYGSQGFKYYQGGRGGPGNTEMFRDMLRIHVEAIDLTTKTLQSQSEEHLERIIAPMADEVHDLLKGDVSDKMDVLYRMVTKLANQRQAAVTSLSRQASLESYSSSPRIRAESVPYDAPSKAPEPEREPKTNSFIKRNTGEATSIETRLQNAVTLRKAASGSLGRSPAEKAHNENHAQTPSIDSPNLTNSTRGSTVSRARSFGALDQHQSPNTTAPSSPNSFISSRNSGYFTALPPPAIPPEDKGFDTLDEEDEETQPFLFSIIPNAGGEPGESKLQRSTTSASQYRAFKKELFRDTITLSDANGIGVSYVHKEDDEVNEMVSAASQCQILLLRKKVTHGGDNVVYKTSVWVFSDDQSVRMEQELNDGEDIIPYTIWGSNTKVFVRVASEVKFYGVTHSAKTSDAIQTNWVAYEFSSEQEANDFQSALMGRTLLLTVKTNRTIRTASGIVGALVYQNTFGYQQHICGLENLRLWQDLDSDGVWLMLHYKPQFRDGYLGFYINSTKRRVRLSERANNIVKLRGLRVPVQDVDGASQKSKSHMESPKLPSIKMITSVKIEFSSANDKKLFVAAFSQIQGFFFDG